MHKAPSVEYPVGLCAFERHVHTLLALLWLLGVQGGWWLANGSASLPGAWWLSMVLGVAGWLMVRWRSRQPVAGVLSWVAEHDSVRRTGRPEPDDDGGRWVWSGGPWRHGTPLVDVEWALDLQSVVLLRVRNDTGHRWWVWGERWLAPALWDDLRRALVADQRKRLG